MKFTLISLFLSLLSYTTTFAQQKEAPAAPIAKEKWELQDYKRFNAYLNTLSQDAYPTLKNEKTKWLFQKLIAPNYKRIMRNEDNSDDVRMTYLFDYQETITSILTKYLSAYATTGNNYGIEISHLSGVLLDSSSEAIPIIKEFMKTLDKNDESYQVRMNGLKQMKLGLKQQLQGALIVVNDIVDSSDEERIIITEYFSNGGADILNFLDESDRKEIISSVQKQIGIETNSKVKELLKELLLKLN